MAKEMTAVANPKWQAGVKERYDAFCEAYCTDSQNGAKAARKAGYKESNARQTARHLLSIPYIRAKIADITAELKIKAYESKKGRQAFWARMIDNNEATNRDRLRASELLGKSEADFTENIHTTTDEQRELDERETVAGKKIAKLLVFDELKGTG